MLSNKSTIGKWSISYQDLVCFPPLVWGPQGLCWGSENILFMRPVDSQLAESNDRWCFYMVNISFLFPFFQLSTWHLHHLPIYVATGSWGSSCEWALSFACCLTQLLNRASQLFVWVINGHFEVDVPTRMSRFLFRSHLMQWHSISTDINIDVSNIHGQLRIVTGHSWRYCTYEGKYW